MSKLTIKQLEELPPNEIFAAGFVDGDLVPELTLKKGIELRWVAARGGIGDFSLYVDVAYLSDKRIYEYGQKIFSKNVIMMLVPMEDDVFDRYRD